MRNGPTTTLQRPATLCDVAASSDSVESFGLNLRDWQHEISRRVTSRAQLQERFRTAPPILASRFAEGKIADAYLAAYAEWLALRANLEAPAWTRQTNRRLLAPWYSSSNHRQLEELSPESFRQRGIFTVPESVFTPRRGRPRVSNEAKRQKAIARQRAYRQRVKALLDKARAQGIR